MAIFSLNPQMNESNPNFDAAGNDGNDADDGVNSHFDAADDEDKPRWPAR